MDRRGANDDGFSLIEVLVVVVIISILASIAIPIFLSQREKAYIAQTETTLKNAATAMEAAATANEGSYEGISPRDLVEDQGLKYSRTVITLTVEGADGSSGFCLSAVHSRSGATLYWDSNTGAPIEEDCSDNY